MLSWSVHVSAFLNSLCLKLITLPSQGVQCPECCMQRPQGTSSPAQAQQSGAVVPSPAPNQASPQSASAGAEGGRPGWQIAVIVIAVVVGVFLAVNAVLIPYMLVSPMPLKALALVSDNS